MKITCYHSEIRFSPWLESLWKEDVEYTFGILKGHWRVLKSGIRVPNTEAADNMWLTCCAMHNMLLNVDGLRVGWQNGLPSHGESQSGQFHDDYSPDAIRWMFSTEQVIRTNYDRSSCGYNPAITTVLFSSEEQDNGQCYIQSQRFIAEGEAVVVNELPLSQFRAVLIENFNDLFHEQKIAWPKRLTGATPRHVPVPTWRERTMHTMLIGAWNETRRTLWGLGTKRGGLCYEDFTKTRMITTSVPCRT